jgi:hypothetical protein
VFLRIPPPEDVLPGIGLNGDEVATLAEDHELKIYWVKGRRLLLASDVFTAIHGSRAPRKFASILANYQSTHEDVKPHGLTPLVSRVHSPGELCRYLDDLQHLTLFLTYTRETVNIYSVQS